MNRLTKSLMPSGILVLALILLTGFLASCGSDDPVAPTETNHAPTAPVINMGEGAPADAAVNVALGAQLHWTCTDPDGDPLTYSVRFGTAAAPPIVAQEQAANSYTPISLGNGITYYWQIAATDDGAKSTSSPVWSFTTIATTTETVSAPTTLSGSTDVSTTETPSYSAFGSVSSASHAVEYRFDWGNGAQSAWGTAGFVPYTWTTAGTYEVTAQARCAVDTNIQSPWSSALTVSVTEPTTETVSYPARPTGPLNGTIGETLTFTTTGTSSSEGHVLEYRFDWHDGTISDWSTGTSASHAWSSAGTYNVEVQARCQEHTGAVSGYSATHQVAISTN